MKINPRIETFLILNFIVIINLTQTSNCQRNELEILKSSLDDAISHTDYLITIYSSTSSKPCFYFTESRYSQPESSLINCTWYKTNACCKRTEVASVFLSMFTLNQASQQCMNLMNYMMCYFCSPEQFIWFRGTQVSICLKFCDEIHAKCKQAEYGGKLIGEIYQDGKAFCEAQDFKVINTNQQCFDFDPSPFSSSVRIYAKKIILFISIFVYNLINIFLI